MWIVIYRQTDNLFLFTSTQIIDSFSSLRDRIEIYFIGSNSSTIYKSHFTFNMKGTFIENLVILKHNLQSWLIFHLIFFLFCSLLDLYTKNLYFSINMNSKLISNYLWLHIIRTIMHRKITLMLYLICHSSCLALISVHPIGEQFHQDLWAVYASRKIN